MFLTYNYIFTDEFMQKTGLHRANISMAKKEAEDMDNFSAVIKLGRYTFIDKTSPDLPKYIKRHIRSHTFTNMKNMLPLMYVRNEFNMTNAEVNALVQTSPDVLSIKSIAGIDFVEFNVEFIDKLENTIPYILTKSDLDSCIHEHCIDGYLRLSKTSFLSWYKCTGEW